MHEVYRSGRRCRAVPIPVGRMGVKSRRKVHAPRVDCALKVEMNTTRFSPRRDRTDTDEG